MLLVVFALFPGKIWKSLALGLVSHELAKAGTHLVWLSPLVCRKLALCACLADERAVLAHLVWHPAKRSKNLQKVAVDGHPLLDIVTDAEKKEGKIS
jgi:hypothetical protein